MRYLHQVRDKEALLASGLYLSSRGEREEWLWNEFPDGGQLLRVDAEEGLRELYFSPLGELTRVDWLQFRRGTPANERIRGTLSYFPESAHLGQRRGNRARNHREWPLGEGCLRVPPALVALGKLVRAVAARVGEAQVFALRVSAVGWQGDLRCWSAVEKVPGQLQLWLGDGANWQLHLDERGIPQSIQTGEVTWELRNHLRRAPRKTVVLR